MRADFIRNLTSIAAFSATLSIAIAAQAKIDPGVWARLDRIVIDATVGQAPTVEMHGAFMLADPAGGREPFVGYAAPERGLVRYECPADQTATCIADWARFAETVGNCIAFGQRLEDNGSVRAEGDQSAPDTYVVVNQSDIDLRIWSGECDPTLAAALDAAEPASTPEPAPEATEPDAESGCSVGAEPATTHGAWYVAFLGLGWTLRAHRRRIRRQATAS